MSADMAEQGIGTWTDLEIIDESGTLTVQEAFEKYGSSTFNVQRGAEYRGMLRPVRFLAPLLEKKPIVRKNICIGCGICVNACPVEGKAIHVEPVEQSGPDCGARSAAGKQRRGVAVYDYSKCIKCYCCQEMCTETRSHGKEIAAGEDRRQELAYLRTGLFVMHAGVSGDGRRSRPVHLCRAGKAPAQALDHAIRHAVHMAQQMADSGHTQHQVTFGQKTAYYTQVMETVFADSIHGLCFFMRRKRRPPSCAARCVHRTAFPAYHHCLPAETPAEQTLMF